MTNASFTLTRSGHIALIAVTIAIVVTSGCSKSTEPDPVDPRLAAVHPDSGGVGTLVEISGGDFVPGATVWFGSIQAASAQHLSASTLLAHAPDGLLEGSSYDVIVINPGDATATLTAAYRAVAPELRVVNGVSRPSGQTGSLVILEGQAFGDLLGTGSVYFTDGGGQPVEAVVDNPDNWANEFVVATVPGSTESGPVWIETPTGVSEFVHFTITQSATFSPSTIQWTATSALPDSVQGHAAVFVSIESEALDVNRIYVTGGANGSVVPGAAVVYAEVTGAGEVAAWMPGPDLPDGRAFHRSVVATPFNAFIDDSTRAGHLYVVGGINSTGVAISSVLRAGITSDGVLTGWTGESPLPEPLHSMGATVFRSWVYVVGGATDGHEPTTGVYRARIEVGGSLGTWEPQTSLPAARGYAPLVQFAGALYVVGGDAGAVEPGINQTGDRLSTIVYARLDLRTATLSSSWTQNGSELIKSVAKHSTIVAGSTMLVSGGIYNGAGSSATEHQYSELNADFTLGSFNGATGSQTIVGSGGEAFYNHSTISYVDGGGNAHVVILGGAEAGDASRTIADTYYY